MIPKQISPVEALAAIQKLRKSEMWGDWQAVHSEIEEILVSASDPRVQKAYSRIVRQASWWAFS